MSRSIRMKVVLILLLVVLVFPVAGGLTEAAAAAPKQMIYDEAGLLNQDQLAGLEALANKYAAKRGLDIIVLTSNNAKGTDVVKLTEDFYDNQGPGYDKPHGNAVILTLDMKNRDIYLAGFAKAETYLDDGRLDKIRNKITPDLSSGDYERAFQIYIKTVYRYMGFRPGVNPDNVMFNLWFQLAVSLAAAGIVVWLMARRSGGRVTVNEKTYEDAETSGILQHEDQYIRTDIVKTEIPKSRGGGGLSGGGGVSGGGYSHSGSRGKF